MAVVDAEFWRSVAEPWKIIIYRELKNQIADDIEVDLKMVRRFPRR